MENIWAPWRIEYIKKNPNNNSCFLCDAFNNEKSQQQLVIYRGRECFSILNKFPYNSGHLMVVPNKHKSDISDLTDSEMLEIMTQARDMKKILSDLMSPEGFNLGFNFGKSAGAGLKDHLHLHIVPRWNGDTNFMPVLSDTKVIPQSLEETGKELRKLLK